MEDEAEEADVGTVDRLGFLEEIVSHELDSICQFRRDFCLGSFYGPLKILNYE